MKLMGMKMVAVAMMVGALGAMGCSQASASDPGPVAPEETAASAPVDDAAQTGKSVGVEKDELRLRYYAPVAPPALRVEFPGRAPSERHFWAPGYWRWNGREHVWVGGRWEERRRGVDYMSPRWSSVGGRWEYRPGYWHRHF